MAGYALQLNLTESCASCSCVLTSLPLTEAQEEEVLQVIFLSAEMLPAAAAAASRWQGAPFPQRCVPPAGQCPAVQQAAGEPAQATRQLGALCGAHLPGSTRWAGRGAGMPRPMSRTQQVTAMWTLSHYQLHRRVLQLSSLCCGATARICQSLAAASVRHRQQPLTPAWLHVQLQVTAGTAGVKHLRLSVSACRRPLR